MNNAGNAEFSAVTKTKFDVHESSRVEITADAAIGAAHMKVAQPVGAPPSLCWISRTPPQARQVAIAWQMRNAGLFDEYTDLSIEAL
jgi:hypothetical protein